ncbi:hypothetical protein [Sphingomonas sp. M1-B02]|uniref:hypothetical protein n=1 Tax=Sphingomonas sp. M1-B02 TaxID=3114300 RepID=UPI00224058AB|nr:hypothetical protein [Sphingomonas sp. S6-11]UZK67664.1 hypothetical protein OKW87_07500 [Sphingomonas sp. S6-11]
MRSQAPQSRGPILRGDAWFKVPGQYRLFKKLRTGRWCIAYHRREGEKGQGPYRGDRRIVIQKLGDGADRMTGV